MGGGVAGSVLLAAVSVAAIAAGGSSPPPPPPQATSSTAVPAVVAQKFIRRTARFIGEFPKVVVVAPLSGAKISCARQFKPIT
jgi:hypothetical protein